MIDALLNSVRRAHESIKNNLVVVWFPPLFGTAMFVLFMLLAVLLILPIVPGILSNPDPNTWAMPEIAEAVGTRALLLFALAIPLIVITNAGTLNMQARIAEGEAVDTSHFFEGIKRFGVRLAAGSLVAFVIYAAIFLLTFGVMLSGLVGFMLESGVGGDIPEQVLYETLMKGLPMLLLGATMFIVASVLLSMWSRVLTLKNLSLWGALLAGGKFALRNFWAIVLLFFGQWMVTTLLHRLLGDVGIMSLITLALNYAIRVYAGVALMHYYLLRTTD